MALPAALANRPKIYTSANEAVDAKHYADVTNPQWWVDNHLDPNAPSAHTSSGPFGSLSDIGQRAFGLLLTPYTGVIGAVAGAQPGVIKALNKSGTTGQNLAGLLHGESTLIEDGKLSNSDRNNGIQFGVKAGAIVVTGAAIGAASGGGEAAASGASASAVEGAPAVEVTEASDYSMAADYLSTDGADVTSSEIANTTYAENGIGEGFAGDAGAAAAGSTGAGVTPAAPAADSFWGTLGKQAATSLVTGTAGGAVAGLFTGKRTGAVVPGDPGKSSLAGGATHVTVGGSGSGSDLLSSLLPGLFGSKSGNGLINADNALPIALAAAAVAALFILKKRRVA